MRTFIFLIAGLLLASCATRVNKTRSDVRKENMISCVHGFLGSDVSPADAIKMCSKIYEKWNTTIEGQL